jgi:hypothetical protein
LELVPRSLEAALRHDRNSGRSYHMAIHHGIAGYQLVGGEVGKENG